MIAHTARKIQILWGLPNRKVIIDFLVDMENKQIDQFTTSVLH